MPACRKLVGRQVVDGRTGRSQIFNHNWSDPATFATLGTIPAREIAELTRWPPGRRRAGRAQSSGRRVRPRPHLRAGVPARGRGVLRRHEVPVSGYRRAGDHPLHPLARRADHQPRDDRHDRHARAARDRSRRAAARSPALAAARSSSRTKASRACSAATCRQTWRQAAVALVPPPHRLGRRACTTACCR